MTEPIRHLNWATVRLARLGSEKYCSSSLVPSRFINSLVPFTDSESATAAPSGARAACRSSHGHRILHAVVATVTVRVTEFFQSHVFGFMGFHIQVPKSLTKSGFREEGPLKGSRLALS